MPIPSVDNQMHIQRTSDFSRDASVMNRRTEHMQSLTTQQGKVQNEQQNTQVQELDTKENPRIREREENEKQGSGGSSAKGNDSQDEQRSAAGNLPIEPSVKALKDRENPPRVIDIRI